MVQDRFITYLTMNKVEYTPFSNDINEFLFSKLEMRLIEVEQWEATFPIDRKIFEDLIINNNELVDAYVELYSKSAKFFVSEMEIRSEVYEFYMMVLKKRISLVFYRKIPADQSRFA